MKTNVKIIRITKYILMMLFSVISTTSLFSQPVIPANTWVQMTPAYVGAPDGGSLFPMKWNNKGAFDPVSNRVLVVDRWYDTLRKLSIYANAVLAYDANANVVTVLKLSNWKVKDTLCSNGQPGCAVASQLPANSSDPTPLDRHPLGNVTLNPDNNKLYISNGLNGGYPYGGIYGNPITNTWALDLSNNRWLFVSNENSTPANPPYPGPSIMTYDPANKVIAHFTDSYFNGSLTYLLDPLTNQWSSVTQDISAQNVHTSGGGICYDTKRNNIMVFGSGGINLGPDDPKLWSYSVAQNKWTSLKDCPKGAVAPGFDYDSKHDVFLALINDSTWIYDPVNDSWKQIITPIDRNGGSWYESVTYDPANDVFVYEGGPTGWQLFRYDVATTVKNNEAKNNIDVYPNPSNGLFTLKIQSEKTESVYISISDITGKIIYYEKFDAVIGSNNVGIDLSKYAKGIYTLKSTSNDEVVVKKLIIQ